MTTPKIEEFLAHCESLGDDELLDEHILKENDVLFQMADKVLTEEVQEKLYDRFEELEEEVIGLGKHEELHKMLEKMSAVYLT